MYINNVQINADLSEIISELKSQLNANGIFLLEKTIDSGSDIMITCPYHADGHERRPSAGIRKSDGLFHCLACGETHSLYEMISHCFGHDEDVLGKFGWNWLLKNFATVRIEERKPIDLHCERKRNNRSNNMADNASDMHFVDEETLDSYRYYHPYWKKRGITNEDIIELFDLGYDKKTDCITFPVRDVNGKCLFVARRSTKTKYFNYPKDVEKPLYGLYELNATTFINGHKIHILPNFPKTIIVCESMLDALSFWQVGKYAVALNGTGTDLQYKQLRSLPCRHIILATDMDSAGTKAREKLRTQLTNKIITEYVFPKNIKDTNQCLCECGEDVLKNIEEIF